MDQSKKNTDLYLQETLQVELESVKPNRPVYVRQQNSHILFLGDRTKLLIDCKKKQKKIKEEILKEQQSKQIK